MEQNDEVQGDMVSLKSFVSIENIKKPRTTCSLPVKKLKECPKQRPHLSLPLCSKKYSDTSESRIQIKSHANSRRRSSVFVYDHFKSTLNFGEKVCLWFYKKLKVLSHKWFYIICLTTILILYTLIGALIFQYVEGSNEKHIKIDLRSERRNLIKSMRQLATEMAKETSVDEYEGAAMRILREYELKVIHWYKEYETYVYSDGKIWTYGNSIVFCGSIYTTIVVSENVPISKTFRPEVIDFVRERKKQKLYSSKVIQVIDPDIILKSQTPIESKFKFIEFIRILRTFTFKELISDFRSFKNDKKDECKKNRLLFNQCLSECLILLILCGVGGFLFKFVEGGFENSYKCGVKRIKRDFIDTLWLKSHNLREEDWKSLARNKLRIFEEELHTAHEAGIKSFSGKQSWSFLNAVFYCFNIITTIGHGVYHPVTKAGKILLMIYALIGIPLFLLYLADFGKLLKKWINFLWKYIRKIYNAGTLRKNVKNEKILEFMQKFEEQNFDRSGVSTSYDNNGDVPITIPIIILLIYIFVGAIPYIALENWSYLDSFYFIFTSITTIGLGDIFPKSSTVMITSIVYMVFGLSLTAMCIEVAQDRISETLRKASTKISTSMGFYGLRADGSLKVTPPVLDDQPSVHSKRKRVLQFTDEKAV